MISLKWLSVERFKCKSTACYLSVITLLLIIPFHAQAWTVYNETNYDILVKLKSVNDNTNINCKPWTRVDGKLVPAGTNTASGGGARATPSWTDNKCNPRGNAATPITVEIMAKLGKKWESLSNRKGRFFCEMKVEAGGTIKVYEQDRFPLPSNLYCLGYGYTGSLVDRSDYFADDIPSSLNSMTPDNRWVRFLVMGDPQYWNTKDELKKTADATLYRMKVILNNNRSAVRGAIISGDMTQNGSIKERDNYYIPGLGKEKEHRFFDGLGNHDVVKGRMIMTKYVRQKSRATTATNREPNGRPHYSWDWHDVHFIQANVYPGNDPHNDTTLDLPGTDPNDALSFIQLDLFAHDPSATNVNPSDKPVVIIQHYGFDSFSLKGWTEAQRVAYWNAIKNYNVIAIFNGHSHLSGSDSSHDSVWKQNFYQPTGADNRPDGRTSIPAFNAAAGRGKYKSGDSAQYDGVFLDVEIDDCNVMDITRKDVDGNQVGSSDGFHSFTFLGTKGASCP